MKQRIWKSIVSAVAGALVAYGVKRVVRAIECKAQKKRIDKQLDRDLADSMDCSDPVTSY